MLRPIVLLMGLTLAGCSGLLSPKSRRSELNLPEDTRFRNFMAEVQATWLDLGPMHAVLSGQRRVLPGWDDLSLNREQRVRQWLEVSLNRVRGEFLGRGVQGDEAELRRGGEAWIAGRLEEQVWLPQVDLLSEAAGAQRLPAQCLWLGPAPRSLAEWQTWLVRLGELPAYLAGLEERLHSKALLRTLPPKQTLLRARTASLAWIAGRPFNSLSSTPSPWQREAGAQLDASPDLEDEERENLRTQIDRVLADQVGPAYQRLAATLDELQSQAPDAVSVYARTDGEAWYAFRLAQIAGEPVLPSVLHERALAEADELQERVRAWLRAKGTPGTVEEFLRDLRESSAWPRSDEATWRERAAGWQRLAHARLEVEGLSAPAKTAELRVRPAELTLAWHPAEFSPVHDTVDLQLDDWPALPALFVPCLVAGETLPGARLQLAQPSGSAATPALLRQEAREAWTLGWNLYATRLAGEWELYASPEEQLGPGPLGLLVRGPHRRRHRPARPPMVT
ncbi:MAG: DUF885 family protein [Planctomycetota bacterium]